MLQTMGPESHINIERDWWVKGISMLSHCTDTMRSTMVHIKGQVWMVQSFYCSIIQTVVKHHLKSTDPELSFSSNLLTMVAPSTSLTSIKFMNT